MNKTMDWDLRRSAHKRLSLPRFQRQSPFRYLTFPLTVPPKIIYDFLETSMKKLDDRVLIETGRKYGVVPDSMKCRAFALFDKGFSREEVRFLLRSYRNAEDPSKFSGTLRKYHKWWQDMQP